jgi:hypothetical protein
LGVCIVYNIVLDTGQASLHGGYQHSKWTAPSRGHARD